MENGAYCVRAGQVCARWSAMQADAGEDEWGGDVASCTPGDMSDRWRARVLMHLNGYRFMAGLPSVADSPRKNREAQACALALHARGGLSHRLTEDEPCYSVDAAAGARNSNLDSSPAVGALSRYMIDPGANNFDSMLHRLWMLATQLGPVGVGSTDRFSCLHVIGGSEGALRDPPWVAWPPPGPVPHAASRADMTGWTVHSSAVNLSRAQVTLTVDGEVRAIEQRELNSAGPAGWGIAFRPDGWLSRVGETYRVRVDDVFGHDWEGPIEYEVQMIDCTQ